MPRTVHRLSAVKVRQLLHDPTAEGRYADGNGLYLQIDNSGGKSWIFIWRRGGRRRIMGLGTARAVTLEVARGLSKEADAMVRKGDDPIAERKRQIAGALTFGQAADKCFAKIEAGWRSNDHRIVWQRSLTAHAKSLLSKPVSEVTTNDVEKVLRPLWLTKYETAIRLRGRIERILHWAKANDHREGENPAAWKDNLKHRLPEQPRKCERTKHHPALPYDEIPAFMAKLRAIEGIGARVLEFLILTAARSKEALSAQWTEINFEQALWTLPGERMKAGVTHVVPLCERAVTILGEQETRRSSSFVFPGFKDGSPLDRQAMRKAIKQVGLSTEQASIHGFRSTFRDWAEDRTPFHREAEMALAHAIGDETERAYRRGTALDKRRELMNAWAAYCELPPQADNVVPMRIPASSGVAS